MGTTPEEDAEALLRVRKAEVRARMRAVRDGIPPVERVRLAGLIRERLLALPEVAGARAVMAFHSIGSEVEMSDISEGLAETGRQILLPVVEAGALQAAPFEPGSELVPGRFGVLEPADRTLAKHERIDVVIVPGLAFDREGYRVGYGGGYYDRFLAALVSRAFRAGVCFEAQLIDAVPHASDDEPVHAVVTEAETIRTHDRGAAGPAGEA